MSILAVISTIVSAVVAVCTTVQAICSVAESVVTLGKCLGIIKTPENQEQIGERCLAAEEQGITPEKYDNDYSAYVKAVNDIDMTNVDKSRWTSQEKALKAIEFSSNFIINDFGPRAQAAILAIANHPESDFYTAERMDHYLKADKEGRIDLDKCIDYIEGKPCDDVSAVRQQLAGIECEIDPRMSEADALDKIDFVRD